MVFKTNLSVLVQLKNSAEIPKVNKIRVNVFMGNKFGLCRLELNLIVLLNSKTTYFIVYAAENDAINSI